MGVTHSAVVRLIYEKGKPEVRKMKTNLIDANHLKGVLALTSVTTEEYAKALEETIEVLSKQPRVTPDIISGTTTTSSYPHRSENYKPTPTLLALQCKSCGGIVDKDTLTCRHCGMTYMLLTNSNPINDWHYNSF